MTDVSAGNFKLPTGWSVRRIDEVARITTGSRNTQDRVEDGLYPFFVRSQEVERINTWSFDGEAVLTAGDGVGTGKVFHYINGKFDCHQRVYRIAEFDEKLNGFFFFKQFSQNFFDRIMSMTAKSSVDSVRREMIAGMEILVPPIEQQAAIARALSDIDNLIASLDALIAKKRDIKQGAMQEFLTGKRRLPGFSGEWTTVPFRQALRVRHGKSQKQVEVEGGTYPILATGGEIGRCNTPLYDKPSVLIGRKGTIDNPQYIDTPFWSVDTLFYTEIQRGFDPKYIYYAFQRIDWKGYNEASGVPSLNAKTIEDIEVALPDESEQKAVVEVLDKMEGEIANAEVKRQKLNLLRQAMMQQLLTGRIRLS